MSILNMGLFFGSAVRLIRRANEMSLEPPARISPAQVHAHKAEEVELRYR